MIRYILLSICALLLLPTHAQSEIEVDWSAYAKDTIMPVFVHSVDLGYDYAGTYSATIEYPDLKPLTPEEVTRFCLPQEKGLPEWPEVSLYKGISAKRGQLDISFIPIIWRDGSYWRIQSFTLKVHRQALSHIRRVVDAASRYADHSVLATGRWVKLRVSDNGIHMLTHDQLSDWGFSDPAKVRLFGYGAHQLSESDVDSWRDDLCEVGVWRGADRILFYANGPVSWTLEDDNTFLHTTNPYSEYGCYFLTEGEESFPMSEIQRGLTLQGSLQTITTTPAYTLREVDDYAWYHGGRCLVENYNYMNGQAKLYSLPTPDISSQTEGVLDVCFTHDSKKGTTSLDVYAYEDSLGTMTLKPVTEQGVASSATESFQVAVGESASQCEIILKHNRAAGISGRLDFLRFSYTRTISLSLPIYATSRGIKSFAIAGANEHTVVWDVTDPVKPAMVPSSLVGDALTFSAECERGTTYIAFDTEAAYPMPEEVGEVANQDLHVAEPIDYVIIVPTSGVLMEQAERLAEEHRMRSALRVKVVRADQVYNEFSSGTPDATAFRRYLKMLYDRASTPAEAPKYLLLFGDGAWDNRMLSPVWKGKSPDDYLLCFEAVNSLSTTQSYVMEDYYGLLDDGEGKNLKRDKVDIGVGRFPVTTAEQAREVVDKVVGYMNNTHAGAWKNTILMLGDDGDEDRHMIDAEAVAQMLESEYPDYMVKRIYWDAFPMDATSTGNSYPTVRKRLLELFKEGALVVNYSGHGSPDVISHERVISRNDMEGLTSPRLPLWITVSCDITPFDNSDQSFGETAFLNPNGGAIGLLTSTRTTYADQNKRINYFFSKHVLARDENNRRLSLGDAYRLAKCNLITTNDVSLRDVTENKLNYVLIGDPALVVGGADFGMVVDELNGVAVGEGEELLLKAGSQVKVKGHVTALDGAPATDFTGLLYASIFDNIEEVTCRNNTKTVEEPLTYRERTKKLFMGSDSIRNGEFSFTFRVPMDINYSQESGLINLYAVDTTYHREAKGMCDEFLLGGTEDNLSSDGQGPEITLYLNSPTFVSGARVNETPLLVAKLSDADGINTAGSIGHNLVAVIDGKASMTYSLNEYYVSDIGGYTHGTVSYMLPELPEGKHTLMFRAWDMMNNSSVVTIEFEVVKGLSPSIVQVLTMPNPATEHVTFMFTHDRPENEVEVTVEVFDLSGRILWQYQECVTTPDNTYTCTWNLCCASGQPLGTGIYLYRVIVSSPTGQSSSKAQKMMIKR